MTFQGQEGSGNITLGVSSVEGAGNSLILGPSGASLLEREDREREWGEVKLKDLRNWTFSANQTIRAFSNQLLTVPDMHLVSLLKTGS